MFFNVSKAFDTVPHLPLLQGMEKLNLNPFLLRWIEATWEVECNMLTVASHGYYQLSLGFLRDQFLDHCCLFVTLMMLRLLPPRGAIWVYLLMILLCTVIKTPAYYIALQDDINSVSTVTSYTWLCFNKTKCRTMLLSRKCTKSCPPPSLLLNGTITLRVLFTCLESS